MRLGFIGLGAMGAPMALNLLRAGHELSVYARRAESARPLLSAGGRSFPSPAELAAEVEVVFTMVRGPSDFEDVVLGDLGVIAGAPAGSLVIDMETIPPDTTRKVGRALADKGIDMLDAPVSGGPSGATEATLSVMVGGDASVLERAVPLLEHLGTKIVHMGELGAGQATKACNQLALVVAAQGVAEALTLARRAGLDPGAVREVLMGGVAASRVLEIFGQRMVDRDFAAGIETGLYHKDLGIVLDLAHGLGQGLPAGALAMQHINALVGRGEDGSDLSALVRVVEELGAPVDARHDL